MYIDAMTLNIMSAITFAPPLLTEFIAFTRYRYYQSAEC